MKTNPNDDAFPCSTGSSFAMTKRELFAGMALQGLATNQEMLFGNKELLEHFGTDGIDKLQANKARRLADALIAELNKE